MGRTPSTTSADSAPEGAPPVPEIMRSAMLANIITLELVEMIDEAAKRHEAATCEPCTGCPRSTGGPGCPRVSRCRARTAPSPPR